MSRKTSLILAVLIIAGAVLMTGCNPSADMSLKFTPQQTTTYKAVSEVVKDFRFEQPNLNKLREEQTKTVIEMTFDQTIKSVDEKGTATAAITIKALKVDMTNKNEKKYAYDSEKDTTSPLNKLLGASYQIAIAPNGTVTVVENQTAKAAVRSGYEKNVASIILDDKNIIARHTVAAMPQEESVQLVKGDSWVMVVASPPGLLAPKNYEKNYTLTALTAQGIATVSMDAGEDAQAASGMGASGNIGIFAKMFDNEDSYTGTMTFDVNSGTLLNMEETLVSTYLAQEMPDKGDPEKGPDTLKMQFTNVVKLEKLD
ncbi:MAG: hypothetical protein ACYSUT_01655 [Planctomycetota bacterium]